MPPFELAARTVYWFFVYGLLGWCAEVIFAAVKEHRLVNRGFLCGPICPIYGFGMVALLYAARALGAPGLPLSVPVVFVVGGVLTTLLELVAGWGLYRLFRIRWWDYTGIPFNLGGYICPQFSLLWGLGSVVMVKGLHPLLARLGDRIPLQALLPLDLILLLVFALGIYFWLAFGSGQRLMGQLYISGNPATYVELGKEAETAGDYAEAGDYFLKALEVRGAELDSSDRDTAVNAANAYIRAENAGRAAEALEYLIAIDPNDPAPYNTLKQLYPDAASRPQRVTQLLQQGAQNTGDASLAQ